MTTRKTFLKSCIGVSLVAFVLGLFPARASAAAPVTNKYQAILIWGSDDDKTPENHKPVSPEVAKKLKNFKWKNYFEVAQKEFTVVKDDKSIKADKEGKEGKGDKNQTKVKMSKDCEIILKLLDNDQVEVTLVGKGKPTSTIKQQLRKGGCLVTGGDASNATGWFIIIKQVE